ncbi:MAG: antitoxin family protein [Phycisphaerae bacterium]|nr:antitoxin family protein [Phycisphaerae bacterium]
MANVIEAIYSNGVLRPVDVLELPEQQRVRLTIEPIDAGPDVDREAALQRLMERLEKSTFSYGGPLPTRDELHERDGCV